MAVQHCETSCYQLLLPFETNTIHAIAKVKLHHDRNVSLPYNYTIIPLKMRTNDTFLKLWDENVESLPETAFEEIQWFPQE